MLEKIIGDLNKTLEENTATTKQLIEKISGLHDYLENNDVKVSPPAITTEPPAKEVKEPAAQKVSSKKDNVEPLKTKEEKQGQSSIDDVRVALKEFVLAHWPGEDKKIVVQRKQELGKFISHFGGGASIVPEIKEAYYTDIIAKTKLPLDEIHAIYEEVYLQEAA